MTLSEEKVSTTGVTPGNCYLGEFILLMLVLKIKTERKLSG